MSYILESCNCNLAEGCQESGHDLARVLCLLSKYALASLITTVLFEIERLSKKLLETIIFNYILYIYIFILLFILLFFFFGARATVTKPISVLSLYLVH